MAAQRKLPKEFDDEVLERVAKGASWPQIAQWLAAEHGIRMNPLSIANRYRTMRKERGELTRDLATARLQSSAMADLDTLERATLELTEVLTEVRNATKATLELKGNGQDYRDSVRLWLDLHRARVTIVEKRLANAGATESAGPDPSLVREALACLQAAQS